MGRFAGTDDQQPDPAEQGATVEGQGSPVGSVTIAASAVIAAPDGGRDAALVVHRLFADDAFQDQSPASGTPARFSASAAMPCATTPAFISTAPSP